jgi:hypothetical protein
MGPLVLTTDEATQVAIPEYTWTYSYAIPCYCLLEYVHVYTYVPYVCTYVPFGTYVFEIIPYVLLAVYVHVCMYHGTYQWYVRTHVHV